MILRIENSARIAKRLVVVAMASLGGLLAVATAAQTEGCQPPLPAQLVFDGVTTRVDEVLYVSPRTTLGTQPAVAGGAWFLDGVAMGAGSLPSTWPAGAHAVLVTAVDSCGQPARLAEQQFVVDAVPPQLEWKVVGRDQLVGKVPNQGGDKRYLWWWMQPGKRRLVWSDGASEWNVLRQYPDTRVATSPTRNTLYVWAPDKNPFDGTESDSVRLAPDRILVVSATDDASGVSGVDIRVRGDDKTLRLVASAVDKVGNSAEVELPYRTRD